MHDSRSVYLLSILGKEFVYYWWIMKPGLSTKFKGDSRQKSWLQFKMAKRRNTVSYMISTTVRFCVCCSVRGCVRLLGTLWTVAHKSMGLDPLSMGFFRQEYWSRLPFPPPRGSSWPRNGICSPENLPCRQILYQLSHRGSSAFLINVKYCLILIFQW